MRESQGILGLSWRVVVTMNGGFDKGFRVSLRLEHVAVPSADGCSPPGRRTPATACRARPAAAPRPPLGQAQRPGVLRLQRGHAGAALRLALAPHLHHRRRAGGSGYPHSGWLLPGGLPGTLLAVTPVHELTCGLPAGAAVDGDKADNAADDEASIAGATVPGYGERRLATWLAPFRRTAGRPEWADPPFLALLLGW
jgi:hypothetical protein